MKNNDIKCTVYDCKYCDTDTMKCVLTTITVESKTNVCGYKESTMCASYKER